MLPYNRLLASTEDFKESNVLLDTETPKFVDFGLARLCNHQANFILPTSLAQQDIWHRSLLMRKSLLLP